MVMDCCMYLLPYDLGLAYIFLAILTHLLLKRFTFMSMCGMNQGLTSVRILLSFPTITRYGHWLWLPKPYLCRTPRATPA
jgi:hypothetical protein